MAPVNLWIGFLLIVLGSGSCQQARTKVVATSKQLHLKEVAPTPKDPYLKVGKAAVGVLIPAGFPAPTLDLHTHPDPSIDKEFWSSEGPRGFVIVTVWNLEDTLMSPAVVSSLFAEYRDEMLETLKVAKEWERTPVVPHRMAMEYRTQAMADGLTIQVRYIADKPRVVDLRFIATNAADLDSPDVKAFFEQVEFYGP